jgi:DHA3 family macrolide efflux protein-like MFS transporter
MVPEEHLTRVASINQTVQGVMNFLAPALGAVLVSFLPLPGVMLVQMALTGGTIIVLLFSHIPQLATRAMRPGLAVDIREGFRFVWNWKGLRTIILLACVMSLLTAPTNALLPLFVTKHLKGGEMELGWLQSGTGIAFIVGGVILGAWGGLKPRIANTVVGLVGSGAGSLIMAGAPVGGFIIALVGTMIGGLMNGFVNAPFMAIMQASVPPGIQGRVFTVTSSLNQASMPIGLLLAAPLADALGIRALFWIAGVAVVLMGIGMRLSSAVMHIEDGVDWGTAQAAVSSVPAGDGAAPGE